MKTNPLLKLLLLALVLLLVFVGFRMFSGTKGGQPAPGATAGQLTPEEMKALGIEGDTPRDTVATLVAQVKQLRNELQTALADNKNQKAEAKRLRAREGEIDQRIRGALDGERNRLRQDREQVAGDRQQTQGLLQDLQKRLDGLSGKGDQSELPVGPQDGEGDTRWIEPDDGRPGADNKANNKAPDAPTSFGPAQKTLTDAAGNAADTLANAGKQAAGAVGASTRPVYTVPANATLTGTVAMTALIGRVPIDGTVNDPYPFKVLIGADNLSANGMELPEVAGAVVSGTASGDWTLSCVRGQIRSVTFVFQDGTIRTVPEDAGRARGNGGGQGNANANGAIQGGLGWISDPYGVPCVSGERRSNAQQYLASQALITAAGAGVASLGKSGSSSFALVPDGKGSLGTAGIGGNEAMGRILAGGVRDMADWVNKLYGQAFASVYVRPGAKVAVHLEQALPIDYDAKGRRVNHHTGETHATDLD